MMHESVNFSRGSGESHSKIKVQFVFSMCHRHASLKEKKYIGESLCVFMLIIVFLA